MKWTKERDLLIAQTMAFVQSIAGKKPEGSARAEARIEFVEVDEIEKAERPVVVAPVANPAPAPRSELREEIQGRVASFRAHQQLFHRERDKYCNSVLTKLRASTGSRPEAPGN
jgi:hypothetical protein